MSIYKRHSHARSDAERARETRLRLRDEAIRLGIAYNPLWTSEEFLEAIEEKRGIIQDGRTTNKRF